MKRKKCDKAILRNRIIAATVAVLLIIAVIVILIPKSKTVSYEITYYGLSGKSVIVRDETVFDLSQYEKLDYNNIIDGQLVEADTEICTAYKKGYLKTNLDKLAETEKNIVTYQNQSIISGYDDKIIEAFDFDIDVTIYKMSTEESGYIELYGKLCSLLSEREEYIQKNYNTDSNTYLQGLYQDERNLADSLVAWSDKFVAQNEGYVGFYCFANEKNSYDELINLSFGEIDDVIDEEDQAKQNCFKLVNGIEWYAFVEADKDEALEVNAYYPVYIGNAAECETGCLVKIIEGKKANIYVFSFNENIEKYLELRETDIKIGSRYEGFSIPSDYIVNSTVTVKVDGRKQKITVNVLYDDGKNSIVEVTDDLKIGEKVYRK